MRVGLAVGCLAFGLLLFELVLTRLFAVVLFSDLAHLTLSVAMLGTGVGALLQHRHRVVSGPQLSSRVAALCAAQGVAMLLAVVAVCRFPMLAAGDTAADASWFHRWAHRFTALRWGWFSAMLAMVAVPSVLAGISLSGVFEHHKSRFGRLYAADLAGAGLGALLAMPAVMWLDGPDAVLLGVAACTVGALSLATGLRGRLLASAGLLACVIATGLSVHDNRAVIQIRRPAAWSQGSVVETRWTPLTRLTRYRDGARELVLLDNASLSEVVTGPEKLQQLMRLANRDLVYRLGAEPGPVAVLAAAAGPEVATARQYGFGPVDAFDVESGTFDMVAGRDSSPLNPYLDPEVHTQRADARSAMTRTPDGHYHVIQLLNGNLFGAAGRLSAAWSPSLLLTADAVDLYLDKLHPDGIISLTGLGDTRWLVQTALSVLADRGVANPESHIAYVGGGQEVFLLRPRPWTRAERRLLMLEKHRQPLVFDPLNPPENVVEVLRSQPDAYSRWNGANLPPLPAPGILTDDHPYVDTPVRAWQALRESRFPDGMIYQTLVGQGVLVVFAGLAFFGLPLVRPEARHELHGAGPLLAYVACLGTGYLAIEVVLMARLTLFVGHPSTAMVTVVTTMLLSSGLGSALTHGVSVAGSLGRLRQLLVLALALGAVHGLWLAPWLEDTLAGGSTAVRVAIAAGSVAPIGLVLGTAFPLAMKGAPARLVPWAWAINGWASVAGGVVTMLLARLFGYSWALAAALGCYAVALVCTRWLTVAEEVREGRPEAVDSLAAR